MAANLVTVERSLNEVSALVCKAGRGARLPAGHPEELARVAVYLANCHPDDLGLISAALEEEQIVPKTQTVNGTLVIGKGAAAVLGPLVVDAFVSGTTHAKVAQHARFVLAALAASGVSAQLEGDVLRRGHRDVRPGLTGPVAISEDIWNQWERVAAKTLVPASDASRFAGAGAGLTDND